MSAPKLLAGSTLIRMSTRSAARRSSLNQPLETFEIFAHRGLAKGCTENTLEAFAQAVNAGAHWLETDAHTTADGVVVAFHDHTLNRLFGTSGTIHDATWEELKDRELVKGGKLATFEQVLRTFPSMPVNVDIKDAATAERIAKITVQERAQDRVRFASFKEERKRRAVQCAAQLGAHIPSSGSELATALFYLCSRVSWRLWPLVRAVTAPWISPFQSLQVPVTQTYAGLTFRVVDRTTVAMAHRFGIKVHVWTIDDEAEMRRLLDLGVDGIVTNRTDLLAKILAGRAAS